MSIHVTEETSCSALGTVGGVHWPLFERCARCRPGESHPLPGARTPHSSLSTQRRSQDVVGTNNRQLRHAHGCLQAGPPQLLPCLEPRNYHLASPQELLLSYE
jgi:hypothetical protein